MVAASDAAVEISVVIPCLNEEEGVGNVVRSAWRGIERLGKTGEVIVVDNGSTDRSVEIAEREGATVIHEEQRGYGRAYLTGLGSARGDVIVMGDADETYDFSKLEDFMAEIDKGAEMVLGSRLRGEIYTGAMPWLHRHVGNPILTRLINLFFGLRVSDAYCGMRMFRRSVLPKLELQATGMEFALEMILKSAKRGVVLSEVPIDYHARAGDSKLHTVRDGWRSLRFLLVHSATFLFLIPGAILLALGLLIVLPLSMGPIDLFGWTWYEHPMIVGMAATLVGAQIVQLGLFARTYAVLYLGDSDPRLELAWSRIRLEHGLLLGLGLFVAGAILLMAIFVEWASGGFGALAREHEALLGVTLVALGVQVIFSSFFLSVLGLRRDVALSREQSARSPARVGVTARG
ncbi:MAG: glycosyltransferase family 2 protein [Gaiellaceae bacterium]